MSSWFEIHDPAFAAYVMHNAPPKRLATGFDWVEGPVWFGDHGCLLFSDIPNNRILRWSEEGLTTFRQPANYANGHTRDRQGRLVSCEHGTRRVTRTEWDGSITVIADSYQGKPLNSPNDVVVARDGAIWFTDPHYGIVTDYEGFKAEAQLPCQVYRVDPSGRSRPSSPTWPARTAWPSAPTKPASTSPIPGGLQPRSAAYHGLRHGLAAAQGGPGVPQDHPRLRRWHPGG
jgi:sugar lactone lactonase YvrE